MESHMQTETEQIDAAAMPLDIQPCKKVYAYSRLRKGNIRLLKLLPYRDITSPLQCSLIDYALQDLAESNHHLYDSLSYAWGSPEKTQYVSIGDCYLPITTNLHAALLHLRDRFLERIIWVDAICINQQDLDERSNQVQHMAMIYTLANRVIVWLGEAEDKSDQALEEVHKSADGQPAGKDQNIQHAVLKLLQRPWFKRIWILQEVAAARNVLIICGSSEIDGYIFCAGINSLQQRYADNPGLWNLIRSATYLIRCNFFQSKQTTSNQGTFSLGIAPLGELIDRYHAREASDRRDKIYALLGMSSDNYSTNDLSPKYDLEWETLFKQVIQLILCKQLSVSISQDQEVAIIKSKCCTLGQVSSVKTDAAWGDKQIVTISSHVLDGQLQGRYWNKSVSWSLSLQTLAISIQKGDIVCLLKGASKPTVIRPMKDYSIIVAIALNPSTVEFTAIKPKVFFSTIDKEAEKASDSWANFLHSVTDFPRNLLLVWDWTKFSSKDGKDHKRFMSNHLFQNEKPAQIMELALILSDLRSYDGATKNLKRAIKSYEREFGSESSYTIAAMRHLATVYEASGSSENKKWRIMAEILSGNQGAGEMILDLISSCDGEVTKLLPNWRWSQVTVTEDIVKATAAAGGKDIMELLLKQRGDQIIITEDIIKAAAATGSKDVMELLLDRRGDQIIITEDTVKAVARNQSSGEQLMKLLLNQRGDEITITDDIMKAAAENHQSGREIIGLLLDRRGDEITITEQIVKAAAGNRQSGGVIIGLLLDHRGDEITITEEIVKAAAGNYESGKLIIELLLNYRGDEITITDDIIKAAAGNRWSGREIIELLLDRRGNNITTAAKDIVRVAARSRD